MLEQVGGMNFIDNITSRGEVVPIELGMQHRQCSAHEVNDFVEPSGARDSLFEPRPGIMERRQGVKHEIRWNLCAHAMR